MHSMFPALSVLICTRSRGEKIRQAVDSVLANSFTAFELVIVDQSSDDRTQQAIAGISDPRIRYLRSATTGLAKSRNIAIRASAAEIIVFTDDDCICDKNWLASIMAAYLDEPLLMGVYGRVLAYGEAKPGMLCHCLIDSMERKTIDRPVIPYNILGHGNNMSFRKDVFRRVGLYIESLGAGTWMKGGEDTELIYRALRKRMKFVYSPDPLVYHDNWMPEEKAAELEKGYILAAVAVFTKYALMLDIRAFAHVIKRGLGVLHRIGYHIVNGNRDHGLAPAMDRLWWYFLGLFMGIKYVFVPIEQYTARNDEIAKISTGRGTTMIKKALKLNDIQEIKERYIHTYDKHRKIIDDMVLFQKNKLNISAHYRKVSTLDTPYDSGTREYAFENNICGTWEYAFILMHLPLQQGLTVLEAASSASILPAYLVSLGFHVISVDLEISYQKNISSESGIDYQIVQADLKQIPLPNSSVDVIVSNSALEHVEEDVAMWKEFTRILRKGGRMIHTFPVAKPGFRSAWLHEPMDFFANPTEEHNKTHRLVNKKIAEQKYFRPNNLWLEIWEEHFYLREIQAYCVVVKE